MVHAIRIGDWNVEPVKELRFKAGPKENEQVMIHYDFTYIPLNYKIQRIITFIKFHSDDKILELLAQQADILKTAFIDTLPKGTDQ